MIDRSVWRKARHHCAALGNDELFKVPQDLGVVVRGKSVAAEICPEAVGVALLGGHSRSQSTVERLLCCASDRALAEHWESHIVGARAELDDLFLGAGLLSEEIIRWKAEHFEAAILVALEQLLEAFVLRCEPAL
eukprot:Amastigsp_a2066_732.p2 type:complete len:135 gc:universal Amastigsp_a2066_732:303-707(+)